MTPFATRAMDRGLAALLVALIRLKNGEFNQNKDCEKVRTDSKIIENAIQNIIKRAEYIEGDKAARQNVEARLKHLMDEWYKKASNPIGGSNLGYQAEKDRVTIGLLKSPGIIEWDDFTCLNSLRDVEPMVNLILDDRNLDPDPTSRSL